MLPHSTKRGTAHNAIYDAGNYSDTFDQDIIEGAVNAISKADTLIIGGTSLVVQPAASLAYNFPGKYLIIINRDRTSKDRDATLVFHENISSVLDKIELD